MPDDPEWTLSADDWRCTVSPFGASLRRLWLQPEGKPPRDILWGYSGTSNKKGGQGDVLVPWPGRIRDGTYSFEGARHELPKNDKDGPNAIHGFLRSRTWEGERTTTTAQFQTHITAEDHPGYPFAFDVAVGYELLPTGLACAFVARNTGSHPAPFGAGFHPYLATPAGVDATTVQVPATRLVAFDGLLPTGQVQPLPPDLDLRAPRTLGPLRLNHCVTGLVPDADGFTRVHVGDVTLWMDRNFPYVVLYTGDALGPEARRGLAVEPMTCATDAFNHPDLGRTTVPPGHAVAGTWGITLRPG